MSNFSRHVNTERGAAMILSVIFFLFISLSIIIGIVTPLSREFSIARDALRSKQSYMLAESGVEDVVYRIKSGLATSATEALVLGDMEAVTTITDLPDNEKEISTIGNVDGHERTIGIGLTAGSGATFSYGVQTGNGGFEISGGGTVHGNVYANGPIIGGGNPTITGSAISAGEYELVPSVSHGATLPPPYAVEFGYENTFPQDVAQSFTVSTSDPIKRIRLYMKRSTSGWMEDITVRITTDNAGQPSKTSLRSVTLPYGEVPTEYGYVTITLSSALTLTPGTTYWLVLDTEETWSARYSIGASSATYADGIAKRGSWANGNGGTWSDSSPSGLDMYFDLYPEGDTGLISGVIVGSAGTGDAWAYEVATSTVNGNLYCQVGSSNNKLCDTSQANPEALPFPVTDTTIDEWKAGAEAGGTTTGNVTIGWEGGTLGPRKIVGNLSVGSGALVLTGPLWVTGTVSLSSGGTIESSNSSESRLIVADGTISINGGGHAVGTTESHILFATTSAADPAISLGGGAGAAVVSAPYGVVSVTGGGDVKAAAAWKIKISGGGEITYESGLIDETFSSGPSGSWTISGWGEE